MVILISKVEGKAVKQPLKVHVLLALCMMVVAEACAQAQSGRVSGKRAESKAQPDDAPVRLHTEEVLLEVSVQSNLGNLPPRLNRADFIVTEDEKRQPITSIL